jgi:hypothetical protein
MKEKGTIIVVDPGADRPLDEFATGQCCHCGGHFPIRPGSGTVRGFCFKCAGPVCGPACAGKCVPAELQLENLEAGRPIDFRPIRSRGVDI